MWKTGVVGRGPRLDRELAGVGSRRLAFTLLAELERTWTPADEPLLARLYNQLVVGGHVHKTTRRARFGDLDARLVEDVTARFADAAPLTVHDVGASSGVTSLELFRAFGGRAHVHASDLFDRLDLATVDGWTVVFDPEGRALQLIGARFVLSPLEGESRRFPVNRLLLRRLERSLLPRARAVLAGEAEGPVESVRLVHPEVARALDAEPGFSFGRHDVFEPTPDRHHVVRALNVLNPGYFGPEKLRAAVRAIAAGLVDGGVLLVGRTIDEENGRTRATAFVRGPGQFEPAWDHEEGAENRDAVADVSLGDGARP